jgi:hypothetical protein
MDEKVEDAVRQAVQDELLMLKQYAAERAFGATTTGMILQAHLVAQHALRRYIEELNPGLGSLVSAKLSFHQLLCLYRENKYALPWLAAGLHALNQVRNKIGHDMHASVPRGMLEPMLVLTRPPKSKRSKDRELEGGTPFACIMFAIYASAALAYLKAWARAMDPNDRRLATHDEVIRILHEFSELNPEGV